MRGLPDRQPGTAWTHGETHDQTEENVMSNDGGLFDRLKDAAVGDERSRSRDDDEGRSRYRDDDERSPSRDDDDD